MARDLYDILDVPQSASSAWIKRAFEVRRESVRADTGLSDKQRSLELLALDEAFRTLSDAARREAYDRKLQDHRDPGTSHHPLLALLVSPGVLAFAFLCLLAAAVYYYGYSIEQGRLRLEQERILAENARFAKELALREEREQQAAEQLAETRRKQQEQSLRTQFERDRRDLDKWQRNVARDMEREQREAERDMQRAREEAEQTEYRGRMQEEERRLQAIQDLERQKRFLRELERR